MQAELKVVGGKQNNQVVPLPQGKFLIGREQDCHLRPNSELVSRHHCVFTTDEFGIRVRDLGSTNGTLVNGERIEKQVVLKAGDRVVVGALNFEVAIREGAPVVSAAGDVASGPQAAVPAPSDVEVGNETVFNLPAVANPETLTDDTQAANSGDTTMIPAQQPPAPGYPAQPQMPYAPPPMQYPPGYGQYQPQPMYPPQYPGMPYPGQQMPGYPMQPQMPPQPMPQMPQQNPPPPTEQPAEASEFPEVSLPKPSETGLKEEPPKPKPAEGETPAANDENPSDSAGDIIKQYIQRRPG